VEYVASLLMDRMFDAVSWDYRHKALNLHGRICLSYSLCWGGLALAAVYLLDHPLAVLLGRVPRATGQTVLTVLMLLAVASAVLTLAALTRTRRRVAALRARAQGVVVPWTSTGWGRVVDRLVPDAVLVNSFPRMTLVVELCRLTGQEPVWIRLRVPRTWRRVIRSIARATTWLAATTPTRAGSDRS
jgi:putative ABC transporter type IV